MKKTVFLLLIAIIFMFDIESDVRGSEVTYDVNNKVFVVSRVDENGMIGFTVEKTGISPFSLKVIDDNENYFIEGIKEIENYYILFGYGFTNDRETEYDSLLFVLDLAGNIVSKDLRDFGSMETIDGIFYIDNVIIAYTESLDEDGFSFLFNSSHFTSYDLDFNYIDSIVIGSKVKNINTTDMYLLVGYTNSEYDIGIRSDLSLVQKNDLLNIQEGHMYVGRAEIEFINGATLNNEYIENGITITYPGDYSLNYNNELYNFTVKPIVSGIIDSKIYNESVTPKFSGGNIILNNDIYILDTVISKPGNYDFIINGVNGYTESISFKITSKMEGIINNNVYSEPVTISFNGDGYLNNQFIESPFEVEECGEYILKIRGENNYLESYFFSIEDEVSKSSFIDFIQRVDILVLVVVLISGGIILKKK